MCVGVCLYMPNTKVEIANQLWSHKQEARGSRRAYEKKWVSYFFQSLSSFCPFFFLQCIHSAVVYSPSRQVFWQSFLSELNKCSPFAHTSAITVCFFPPSPNYSKHHTSRSASSVTPRRDFAESKGLRDLERTSRSFDLVKEGDCSSSPHCYHHQSVQILQLCSPLPPPNPTDFLQDFSKYFAWK